MTLRQVLEPRMVGFFGNSSVGECPVLLLCQLPTLPAPRLALGWVLGGERSCVPAVLMLNSGPSCFFLFPLELGSKSTECSLPGEVLSWRSQGWNTGPACQAREGFQQGHF